MFFVTTHDTFNASGVFSAENDALKLEHSHKDVTVIAHSEEAKYDKPPKLQVVSVRVPQTFQELTTEWWKLEPRGFQAGKARYDLVFDGTAFTNSFNARRYPQDEVLHRMFLYGGEIEITVADDHEATHVFLRLDYGAAPNANS